MLDIKNLDFRLAGNSIFSSASAHIPTGSKVGVVGRNGTGKTTLFKLIKKEYALDSGEINVKNKTSIGGVSQNVPNSFETLISTVMSADKELSSLLQEEKIAQEPRRIAEIQERLSDIEGYSAEARASNILHGLGFNKNDQIRSCNEFSGGWQMRVALASILFSAPDLLLLDEPTNYLDLEGSIWLESFLSKYTKTVLLISHDRRILNRSVNKILHIENENFTLYSGNYDFFIKKYNENRKLEASLAKKEERNRAHMQTFVNKFRATASKAKQAQSRLKALKKMQSTPQLRNNKIANFFVPSPKILAPPIINLSNISVGYDKKIILKNLNLRIDPEDRIALLGANGEGKSTFVKLLVGHLSQIQGKIIKTNKLRIGYFSQDIVDSLVVTSTAFEHVANIMCSSNKNEIISKLALGGITEDQVFVKVQNLSGGQKARLAMLLATINVPHLLVLDEPTNHLDIESREILAANLIRFSGAIVLVSHDPYLIDLVATNLWLVKNGTIREFDSDLTMYEKSLLAGNVIKKKSNQSQKKENVLDQNKISIENEAIINQLEAAEIRIKKLEEMRKLLDNEFSNPNIYVPENSIRLKKLEEKNNELNKATKLAEKIWIDITKKLETKAKK